MDECYFRKYKDSKGFINVVGTCDEDGKSLTDIYVDEKGEVLTAIGEVMDFDELLAFGGVVR